LSDWPAEFPRLEARVVAIAAAVVVVVKGSAMGKQSEVAAATIDSSISTPYSHPPICGRRSWHTSSRAGHGQNPVLRVEGLGFRV